MKDQIPHTSPVGTLVFRLKLCALAVRLRVYAQNERRRSRAALWQWTLGEQYGRWKARAEVETFAHGHLQAHLLALQHCLRMAEAAPQSERLGWIGKALAQVSSLQRGITRLATDSREPNRSAQFEQTLCEHVASLSAAYSACSCQIEVLGVSFGCLAPETQQALLLVLYNALQNAYRHAQPASILVQLQYAPDAVILIVADDGCGLPVGATASTGRGLVDMRRAMEQCGGTFAIETAQDAGTRITATAPYPR